MIFPSPIGDTYDTSDLHFSFESQGRGHYLIICNVNDGLRQKKFTHLTTNSTFIDEVNQMRRDDVGYDKIQLKYYEQYYDEMRDFILQWWCEE